MGYSFEPRTVYGSDGWELSGATHGSAVHTEQAIDLLRVAPEEAVRLCGVALRLSPSFIMAQVVMAHALMVGEPIIGRAASLLLAWNAGTEREKSHLGLLASAGPRGVDTDLLRRHLQRWPGDRLAVSLSDEAGAAANGTEPPVRLCAC